jgi:hypothetical protein
MNRIIDVTEKQINALFSLLFGETELDLRITGLSRHFDEVTFRAEHLDATNLKEACHRHGVDAYLLTETNFFTDTTTFRMVILEEESHGPAQDIMWQLLMSEGHAAEFPGTKVIATMLSRGDTVLTSAAARALLASGPMSRFVTCKDSDKGVDLIEMTLDPAAWGCREYLDLVKDTIQKTRWSLISAMSDMRSTRLLR